MVYDTNLESYCSKAPIWYSSKLHLPRAFALKWLFSLHHYYIMFYWRPFFPLHSIIWVINYFTFNQTRKIAI